MATGCPECGRDLSGDERYCPGCGHELQETTASQSSSSDAGASDQGQSGSGWVTVTGGRFDLFTSREGAFQIGRILTAPHLFFRDNPRYTLVHTVPLALVVIGILAVEGIVPTTVTGVCEAASSWPTDTVSCTASPEKGLAVNDAGEKSVIEPGLVQQQTESG